jgi:hypothetical protein
VHSSSEDIYEILQLLQTTLRWRVNAPKHFEKYDKKGHTVFVDALVPITISSHLDLQVNDPIRQTEN